MKFNFALFLPLMLLLACQKPDPFPKADFEELKFDFSHKGELVYDFDHFSEERLTRTSPQSFDRAPATQRGITGRLILDIEEEDVDLLLKADSLWTVKEDSPKDSLWQYNIRESLQGFNTYGESSLNPAHTERFQNLFPLPYRNKIEGERTIWTRQHLMQAGPHRLTYLGRTSFKIIDTLMYKGHPCLKVKVRTNISQLQLPSPVGINDNYGMVIKTDFLGYFDYVGNYYVEGEGKSTTYSKKPVSPSSASEDQQLLINEQAEKYSYQLKGFPEDGS